MALRIRKGDQVIVLAGRDKGKRGEVLHVFPREGRALVQGVHMARRATKPAAGQPGGLVAKETKIHISNLALEDPTSKRATRFRVVATEEGKRREATGSGERLDV